MNKDLLDQIPVNEQRVASRLNTLIEEMQPSQAFQWELENQLMDKAGKHRPAQGWFKTIIAPLGWAFAVLAGVLLLNWTLRSLASQPSPAAGSTATREVSFVDSVRSGDICMGPLAVGHGFAVFLTNPEKTEFVVVDAGSPSGELRSFSWSADGERLAIVGNEMGSGTIHVTDPTGGKTEYLLSGSEVGYLMDAAWSRDGKQMVMWSSQNNRVLYFLNADGTGLTQKQLNVQIIGTPQFWPDGSSVVFYGTTPTASGLFEVILTDSQASLINSSVESSSSYTFSPDGSQLAYMEYDRDNGEARLVSEDLTTREIAILAALPIPRGSGSAVPQTANLSWSADGNFLVFDFGRNAVDRAVYLARTDGSGLDRIVDSAYAPSVSADGKCLAYISENRVFLMDLTSPASSSTSQAAILLSELPTGRGTANTRQDRLQWRP